MLLAMDSESISLDVGPGLSTRQRKAAAAIGLSQLLALAELRAAACRAASATRIRSPLDKATKRQQSSSVAAIHQLRQGAAKRKAESDADAATSGPLPLPSTASGHHVRTSIGSKRIAIQPPFGTVAPAQPASLGCHLARRRPGDPGPGGRVRGASTNTGGCSSLARVYGGTVRVGLLPEDYAECFVGLEPVPEPEPAELAGTGPGAGGLPNPAGLAPPGALAGAEAALVAAGASGMLGVAGVSGDPSAFLFTSPSGLLQQQPQQYLPQDDLSAGAGLLLGDPAAAAAAGGALSGGLMAPGQDPALAAAAAVAGGILAFGQVAGGDVAAQPGPGTELMLDDVDEDDDSDSEDGDMDMGQGAGLGAGAMGPGYAGGFGGAEDVMDGGGGAGGGMDGGYGAGYGFGNGVMGVPVAGLDMGGGGMAGGSAAGATVQDDDGALVEEF